MVAFVLTNMLSLCIFSVYSLLFEMLTKVTTLLKFPCIYCKMKKSRKLCCRWWVTKCIYEQIVKRSDKNTRQKWQIISNKAFLSVFFSSLFFIFFTLSFSKVASMTMTTTTTTTTIDVSYVILLRRWLKWVLQQTTLHKIDAAAMMYTFRFLSLTFSITFPFNKSSRRVLSAIFFFFVPFGIHELCVVCICIWTLYIWMWEKKIAPEKNTM